MPTWFATNNLASVYQELSETDPGTEAFASPVTGWIVGTGASGTAPFNSQVEQATATFTGTHPDGSIDITTGDCFRTANAYTGSFAAGNWTLSFCVRAQTSATGQDGRILCRLFRGANADGSGATEITAAAQVGSGTTDLLTTVTQTSTITFNPGAFSVNNEFIFVQLAWERLGAASMSTADVNMRIGNSAGAGTRLVSATFSAIEARPLTVTGTVTPAFTATAITSAQLQAIGSTVVAASGSSIAAAPELHIASTQTTIQFRKTILYPSIQAPVEQAIFAAGTFTITGTTIATYTASAVRDGQLAIAGTTVPLFTAPAIEAGAFAIAGALTANFVSPAVAAEIQVAQTNAAIFFRRFLLYPSLQQPVFAPVAAVSGQLTISGATTVTFTATALKPTQLQITGATTFIAFATGITPTQLTITLSTVPQFVGGATRAGRLEIVNASAIAFVGTFTAAGVGQLIITGTSVPQFVGRATAAGQLQITGSATASFIGAATAAAQLQIGGMTSTPAWIGSRVLATQLTISGTTVPLWSGVGLASGVGTFAITGSTAIAWTSPAVNIQAGAFSIAGQSEAQWLGSALRAAQLQIAGITSLAFLGASIRSGALSISGALTAAFIGARLRATQLTISAATNVNFVGHATVAAQLAIAGTTTLQLQGRSTVSAILTAIGNSDIHWSTTPQRKPTIARSRSQQDLPRRRAMPMPRRCPVLSTACRPRFTS